MSVSQSSKNNIQAVFCQPFSAFFVKRPKRFGFTLAEVLITLGIIGIISAMTLPSLIAGQQEKATVTALKKAYTTFSQAYISAVQDNGSPDTWNISTGQDVLNILTPYMKNTVLSDQGPLYSYLNGTTWRALNNGNEKVSKLNDGSFIGFSQVWTGCTRQCGTSQALQNVCAEIFIDINGYKKPNMLGKDMFGFYISKYAFIPAGTSQEQRYSFGHSKDGYSCDLTSYRTGFGCTAWALYNENLDYLHCDNLAWNGPLSCQ